MDGDKMEAHTGLLYSIWISTLDPLVIHFVVETPSKEIQCSFSDGNIADKILFLPNKCYIVEITGERGSNSLFTVSTIKIKNPDRTTMKLGL